MHRIQLHVFDVENPTSVEINDGDAFDNTEKVDTWGYAPTIAGCCGSVQYTTIKTNINNKGCMLSITDQCERVPDGVDSTEKPYFVDNVQVGDKWINFLLRGSRGN
jgi:hypothetical protein